jgi:hypothetical protein
MAERRLALPRHMAWRAPMTSQPNSANHFMASLSAHDSELMKPHLHPLNRLWSTASVSGHTRFGTRLGDPKGLPSCTGLPQSARFSLPLLDRWPKRSESLLRANRLVARNPLCRELARQRDILRPFRRQHFDPRERCVRKVDATSNDTLKRRERVRPPGFHKWLS